MDRKYVYDKHGSLIGVIKRIPPEQEEDNGDGCGCGCFIIIILFLLLSGIVRIGFH